MNKKKNIKAKHHQNYLLYTVITILILSIITLIFVLVNTLSKQKNDTAPQRISVQKNVYNNNSQIQQQPQDKQNPIQQQPLDEPPFKEYKFRFTHQINIKGPIDELIYKVAIPQNENAKQYIQFTKISQKPDKIYKTGNDTIGEYIFNNVQTGKKTIIYEGIAKVRTYDLAVAKKLNRNDSKNEDLSRYLKPEKYIESNDKIIIDAANKINGNSQEEIVQNIYVFIQKNLKYAIVPNLGAKQALIKKTGKCSEYASLMTALCRAKNIPARVVTGEMLQQNSLAHAWVEIYFDKYGWVTFDPTYHGIVVRKKVNGKVVEQKINYKSDDTMVDYIILGRNYIQFRNITYNMSNNYAKAASNIKFEILQ